MAAILTDPPNRCAACGAAFACGVASAACWCAQLPALRRPPALRAVLPPRGDDTTPPSAGCLCPRCLGLALEREKVLESAGVQAIEPAADAARSARIDAAWAGKTMPGGALGALQALARTIALAQGTDSPHIGRTALVVFGGDHGLAAEGVSAYPQAVTAQMLQNFAAGGAAINVLCRTHGIALTVVDAGVAGALPAAGAAHTPAHAPARAPAPAACPSRVLERAVARGTANPFDGPAMTEEQALEAIRRGADVVRAIEADAIGLGEMGIGNTSSAALLLARLLGRPVGDCTGRGAGLDDAGLAHKRRVLERCLAAHPNAVSPLQALGAFGGFETAMLVGAMLAAAACRRIVVVDGFIVTAALLVAARIEPAVLGYCVFAHRSAEAGHGLALQALGAEPLLDLGLRLGEGSGAALAMPLLVAATALLSDMASFDSAGVSRATPPASSVPGLVPSQVPDRRSAPMAGRPR